MSLPYRYVIGLEIHAELNTATKMFCRCANAPFGAEPNEHTCPVCLALPGTLPVPNKEAVRKTILVGKALGSRINEVSRWDRKHYFYPDLPKGYQISQYDLPFCVGGSLKLLGDGSEIRFNRVHLEEDAGKLMHGAGGYTKVDLSRAGVPLIEMVTEPDLRSPEQARAFMQEVRLLVRTLGVSDGDMEKGQMRCDVNVSLEFEHEGKTVNTAITEVKNVNSTKAVERSLQIEGQRIYDEWMAGGPVRTRTAKLTAGYDEETGTVRINRTKEEANEYRYFPEPDLPPVRPFEVPELNPDLMVLPELPNQKRERYMGLGLSLVDADLLVTDADRAELLAEVSALQVPPKQAANWVVNHFDFTSGFLAIRGDLLKELMELEGAGTISINLVKKQLPQIGAELSSSDQPSLISALKTLGLVIEQDDSAMQDAIKEVLAEQSQVVAQWQAGDQKVIGFLVGQVMKKAAGKVQPAKVQEALRAALAAL